MWRELFFLITPHGDVMPYPGLVDQPLFPEVASL